MPEFCPAERTDVAGARDTEHPGDPEQRAALGEVTNNTGMRSSTRSTRVPASHEAVPDDGHTSELLEPPTVDVLKESAAKMFTDASGGRVELPPLAVAYQSTNSLIVNSKEAVRQLFEQKRKEMCSSPERADLKLSQEEALGWLLAYARGRRLLVEEARPIGKAAGEQATAAKKLLDAVRGAAKTKRSKARKREATAEEIEAIDAAAAGERTAILEKVFYLKHMPAANSVIVEGRPRPQPEHVCSEACSGEELCPRARALIEAATSDEAAVMIDTAYTVIKLSKRGGDAHFNEKLELAQVRYGHALRRFKQQNPEFCGWGSHPAELVVTWTVQFAAAGYPIPAAAAAASRIRFDMSRAVMQCRAADQKKMV